jgi:hypothetical protein
MCSVIAKHVTQGSAAALSLGHTAVTYHIFSAFKHSANALYQPMLSVYLLALLTDYQSVGH